MFERNCNKKAKRNEATKTFFFGGKRNNRQNNNCCREDRNMDENNDLSLNPPLISKILTF
jgi:hypothetical protein